MKKLLGFALMSALCASLVMPVSAEEKSKTGTVVTNDSDGTVPGEGTIGIEEGTIDDWIDITIPSKFEWAAYAADYTIKGKDIVVPAGDVTSAEYEIKNNIERSNVKVTLKSFLQEEEVQKFDRANMKLYLTGNLSEDGFGDINIANDYENPNLTDQSKDYGAYSKVLEGKADSAWTFSFGGHYSGKFYPNALVPEYTMTLHFNLESINGVE